jgi:osmotically-inducible protein OsmY
MPITRRFVQCAALSMLPIAFGCQTMHSETSETKVAIPAVETETQQDQVLSKSVRARLLADKKVDLSGIKVVSNNGTVYLSGVVSSLDARQQAIKLAWETRGVQSVVNSLEVQ